MSEDDDPVTVREMSIYVKGREKVAIVAWGIIALGVTVVGHLNNLQLQGISDTNQKVSEQAQQVSEQTQETAKVLERTSANVSALAVRLQDTRDAHEKDIEDLEDDVREVRRNARHNRED